MSTNEQVKPGNTSNSADQIQPEQSHPIGTGVGAAAGGAAGAAIGAAAGPIGSAVGLAAGALIGGIAGKSVASQVNPTEEEAFWREHHPSQPYAEGSKYEEYQPAYRVGFEGYSRYAQSGKGYEEIESDLQQEYEKSGSSGALGWEKARLAARAAWDRLENNWDRLMDYEVVDKTGTTIGTITAIWEDSTGQPAFLGVKTGWLGFGKTHVIPVHVAEVSRVTRRVRIPFTKETVKSAPAIAADAEVSPLIEKKVYDYYSRVGFSDGTKKTQGPEISTMNDDSTIRVGPRQIEGGGSRLRKRFSPQSKGQPASHTPSASEPDQPVPDQFVPLRPRRSSGGKR